MIKSRHPLIWFTLPLLFCSLAIAIAANNVLQKQSHKYEKGNKRNPFIPVVTNDGQLINIDTEAKEARLVLEGIIYDKGGQSMAIINGKILKKNDTILDAKIVEVRKDSVVYVKDGEISVLELKRKNQDKEGGL